MLCWCRKTVKKSNWFERKIWMFWLYVVCNSKSKYRNTPEVNVRKKIKSNKKQRKIHTKVQCTGWILCDSRNTRRKWPILIQVSYYYYFILFFIFALRFFVTFVVISFVSHWCFRHICMSVRVDGGIVNAMFYFLIYFVFSSLTLEHS